MLNETITVKLLPGTDRLTLMDCRVHKALARRLGATSAWVDYNDLKDELDIEYNDVKSAVRRLVQAGVLIKSRETLTINKEFVL